MCHLPCDCWQTVRWDVSQDWQDEAALTGQWELMHGVSCVRLSCNSGFPGQQQLQNSTKPARNGAYKAYQSW